MSAQAVRSWILEDLKAGVYELHILFDSIMSVSTVVAASISVSPDSGVTEYTAATATMISTANSKYLKIAIDAAFRNSIQLEGAADKGTMELKLLAGAFKDNTEAACGATGYADDIRCHVISLDLYTTKNYEVINATTLKREIYLPRDTAFTNSDTWDHPISVATDFIYGGGVATAKEISTNSTTEVGTIAIKDTADHVVSAADPQKIVFYNIVFNGSFQHGDVASVATNFIILQCINCLFAVSNTIKYDAYKNANNPDFFFDRCTFNYYMLEQGATASTQRYINCLFKNPSLGWGEGGNYTPNIVFFANHFVGFSDPSVAAEPLMVNNTITKSTTYGYNFINGETGEITLSELEEGTSWSSGDPIVVGRTWTKDDNNDPISSEISIGIPHGDFCPIGAFQSAVTQDLTITGAVLSGGNKIVTLTTTETLIAADTYRVIVNNVEDTSGNIIEAGTTEIFVAT